MSNPAALVSFTDTSYVGGSSATAPSAATEGMDLSTATHYRVIVSADPGQTLTGTGGVRFYCYSAALSRWCACPQNDFTITPSGNANAWVPVRDLSSADYDDVVSFGRIAVRPESVGVSSGSVTVTIEAWKAP